MITAKDALSALPVGLRDPLLAEYRSVKHNYAERRWSPSELSGGRLCEIVYTVLKGYADGKYPNGPSKPRDFVGACRALEAHTNVPRSFQILIPRLLPALYEVRSNRGVGHVGGDVDPNHMDATFVASSADWLMAELVRVFHGLPIQEAQRLVDQIVESRVPLIWQGENMRRVLDPSMSLRNQTLLLIASCSSKVMADELFDWTGYGNKTYFKKLLREMHTSRRIELSKDEISLEILPPGSKEVEQIVRDRMH